MMTALALILWSLVEGLTVYRLAWRRGHRAGVADAAALVYPEKQP